MNTELVGAVKRLPKKLWILGKRMAKLARVSNAYLRTAHSYRMKFAKLEQERDEKLNAIKLEQHAIIESIFSVATEQKQEIMKNGKSVTLSTGQVGWRAITPSVLVETGHTERSVIQWLKSHRQKYLRSTPKLNKEKILQDHRDGVLRKIPGLRITEGTEFFISLAPRGKDKPETIVINIPS